MRVELDVTQPSGSKSAYKNITEAKSSVKMKSPKVGIDDIAQDWRTVNRPSRSISVFVVVVSFLCNQVFSS